MSIVRKMQSRQNIVRKISDIVNRFIVRTMLQLRQSEGEQNSPSDRKEVLQ
jgi:hypothetical protein